jgi:hypothetical protein
MFCPQSVAWGDMATWAGAVATTAAVIVALVTAKRAGDVALKVHEKEENARRAKDDSLRHQLSIAFDSELYMAIGQLDLFCAHLEDALGGASYQIESVMKVLYPKHGLSVVSRFSDRLDVFPIALSGELLAILSRWNMVHEAPAAEFSSEGQLQEGAAAVLRAMTLLSRDMQRVRMLVREHALPDTKLTPI